MKIDVKNRFSVGDKLEIIQSNGNQDILLDQIWDLDGNLVKVAPGSGHVVWAKLPLVTKGAFIARYLDAEETSSLGKIAIVEKNCN